MKTGAGKMTADSCVATHQQVVEKVVFFQAGQKHSDARRAKS